MPHFLGVDVGGTNTRLMLMDSQQNFRGYHKTPTQSWAGQSDPLQGLENLITAYLQEQDPHNQVAQVMLGLPAYCPATARPCCRCRLSPRWIISRWRRCSRNVYTCRWRWTKTLTI